MVGGYLLAPAALLPGKKLTLLRIGVRVARRASLDVWRKENLLPLGQVNPQTVNPQTVNPVAYLIYRLRYPGSAPPYDNEMSLKRITWNTSKCNAVPWIHTCSGNTNQLKVLTGFATSLVWNFETIPTQLKSLSATLASQMYTEQNMTAAHLPTHKALDDAIT